LPSGAHCVGPSPSTDALRPCILWPKHGSHPICFLSRRVVPVGVPDVIWGRRHMNRPKRPICATPLWFYGGVLRVEPFIGISPWHLCLCYMCGRNTSIRKQTAIPKCHRPQHAFSGKTIIKIENSCIIRKSCASTNFAHMQSVHNFSWGE
jgi:hypothetical protein